MVCACQKYHHHIQDSFKMLTLEINYPQLTQEQKNDLKKSVTYRKECYLSEVFQKMGNKMTVKMTDRNVFREKFKNSKSFHKILVKREAIEAKMEKLFIDLFVEKIFPETRDYCYFVEADRHDFEPAYMAKKQKNIVTGRILGDSLEKRQYDDDFFEIAKKELKELGN